MSAAAPPKFFSWHTVYPFPGSLPNIFSTPSTLNQPYLTLWIFISVRGISSSSSSFFLSSLSFFLSSLTYYLLSLSFYLWSLSFRYVSVIPLIIFDKFFSVYVWVSSRLVLLIFSLVTLIWVSFSFIFTYLSSFLFLSSCFCTSCFCTSWLWSDLGEYASVILLIIFT